MMEIKISFPKRTPKLQYLFPLIFLILTFQFISPKESYAWKPLTHIYLSNEVVKDVQDGELEFDIVNYENATVIKPLGKYKVNKEMKELVTANKKVFFSGNFGPDAYPDVITGGMVIHADLTKKGGAATSAWLRYLWENGYKNQTDPDIKAWVLGFLCHAAGDMYIHTFLNHYAGGAFDLKDGDNAARHILLEGYIAKRHDGPRIYDVDLPKSVKDFIYKYMVKADQNTYLRDKLLIYEADAKLTPPLRFTMLKEWVKDKLIDNMWYSDLKVPFTEFNVNLVTEYADYWVDDIDQGLRAWVDFSHDFAVGFFFKHDVYKMPYHEFKVPFTDKTIKEEDIREDLKKHLKQFLAEKETTEKMSEVSEEYQVSDKLKDLQKQLGFPDKEEEDPDIKKKKDLIMQLTLNYTYDHILSMLGLPDAVGTYGVRYPAAVFEEAFKVLRKDIPKPIRDLFRSLKGGVEDYLCQRAFGFPYETIKAFEDHPETYFDNVLNAAPGVNANARTISIAEANKVLKINDPGYTKPDQKWRIENFPPAYNTIVLIKLMMLEESELYRLFSDLAKIVGKKDKSELRMITPNVMIDGDFCRSIDENNSWKFGNMTIAARNPDYYSLLFMKQIGEDPIDKPFKYEEAAPEGAVISHVDLINRYMEDFKKWADFKAKEFINWFLQTSAEYQKAGREIAKRYFRFKFSETDKYWQMSDEIKDKIKSQIDYYQDKIKAYLENTDVPSNITHFYEKLTFTDLEQKLIKAGEDLAFKIKYYVWGYEGKEVKVKVVATTTDAGTVAIPFEKTHKFSDKRDQCQEGEAEFSFACQYPTEAYEKKDGQRKDTNTTGRAVNLKLFVDDEVASEVQLDNVYKVEGPGTDFNGYANLRVNVKYDFRVPKEWEFEKSRYKPTFKVTLVPMTELKEEMKKKVPKPIIDKRDAFDFERVPMGQYKVLVEVMKEEAPAEDFEPQEAPPQEDGLETDFMQSTKNFLFGLPLAYAQADNPPQYSGPGRGEAFVTLFNSAPVDPAHIEKVETKYLPSFTVEVELGKIDAEELLAKKKKKQASLWKVLVAVQDESGRPVINADVSTSGINCEKKDLGEGKWLLGPFDAKTQKLKLYARVWEQKAHLQQPLARYGEVEAVYNGNSQINEVIIVRGLQQPKWTIFGRAQYQDGSPLIIKDTDTFDIVMQLNADVSREIKGLAYAFGPFAVPVDSGFEDAQKDFNTRDFAATVMRDKQIIARATGQARRKGEEGTEFNIKFPNQYKKIIEAEEGGGEEEDKEEEKPSFVDNTKKDNKSDTKKKVPSFVKNTDKGTDNTKDKSQSPPTNPPLKPPVPVKQVPAKPVATAPAHVCVDPRNLEAPRSFEDVPAVLDAMGIDILSSQSGVYTLQIRDGDCAAKYGIREKKVWRAGAPTQGARFEADAKIPADKGAFTWTIDCTVENKAGKIMINLWAVSLDVINWGLIPDFIGIVARGENNQPFDIKYNQRSASPPAPKPVPVNVPPTEPAKVPPSNVQPEGRPTLFNQTFDGEIKSPPPARPSGKVGTGKNDDDEFWGDLRNSQP